MRLLENLRRRTVPEAEALYAEIETENTQIIAARPHLAARIAGESRCISAILHAVLKQTTKQLA